jgi:hypothetical protein
MENRIDTKMAKDTKKKVCGIEEGPRMTAAKSRARIWAERMDWSPVKFEKAGLKKIEMVRGHEEAAELIAGNSHVLLGTLGIDYLIGELS